MTDDLEGRLSLKDLQTPAASPPSLMPDALYESDDERLAENPEPEGRTVATISTSRSNDFPLELDQVICGTLSAFSFGKGWLCMIEDVDEDQALAMAMTCPKLVRFKVKEKEFDLYDDLDFTLTFNHGVCSLTVTADHGRYVST